MLAAGSSRRMGGGDKLFAELGGRPVLWWSLRAFDGCDAVDDLVVVASERNRESAAALSAEFEKVRAVVLGGAERQDSVASGLRALAGASIVAVHDGARPLVAGATIERGVELAQAQGAAVAGSAVADTIKEVDGGERVVRTPERARLRAAATPQVFRRELLVAAHQRAARDGVYGTDDAGLVEHLGEAVLIYESAGANPKITRAEDLLIAEALLAAREGTLDPAPALQTAVGIGIDSHPFAAERALVLGGVRIRERDGLAGHSDADALTHAVIDALLGAAGLGDIGMRFEPGDPRWAGADSIDLLRRTVSSLAEAGWRPLTVDATVIADQPRLRPHIAAMRERLAEALGLPSERVNVKATTSEGMGTSSGSGVTVHAAAQAGRAGALG